jgi:sugar transferase (PEP-CTERM/EpsH1 system associated)
MHTMGALVTGGSTTHEAIVTRHGSPVHVMHVVYALQPGGMELGVVKVVNGLDRARVRSSICSTVPATHSVRELVSTDVPVFELQRRAGNDPRLVADLYRLFRRERPGVVHTHAWGTLIEGLIAARLARVPYVIHGEHGTLQLKGYQARIQRWAWNRTTQVLSVSRRLADRMAETTGVDPSRIQTIQNGVDCERFSPRHRMAGRARLALPPETLAIGTAGRLVPVKNQVSLIEAFGRLRAAGVHFRGYIAGDGPLRSELESKITALGLEDHVQLLGHCEDLQQILAGLDIFVLPSRSEGMSNTILEAMASGTPVVATNVGGAEELVAHEQTGLLVPAEDSAALTRALVRMQTDDGRRRAMGRAGRMLTETTFSIRRMVREYEHLYAGFGGDLRQGAS